MADLHVRVKHLERENEYLSTKVERLKQWLWERDAIIGALDVLLGAAIDVEQPRDRFRPNTDS